MLRWLPKFDDSPAPPAAPRSVLRLEGLEARTVLSTATGLDRLVDIILADKGLKANVPAAEIQAGADAADGMNQIVVDSIKATGLANDGDINTADVRDLNAYIRANHLAEWTALHGDDEGGTETGFHLVQGDGARTRLFGQNAVDTIADGIYHLGFEIRDDRFVNEDGDANACVSDVAKWVDRLLRKDLEAGTLRNGGVDPYARGTTGTGLDRLVNIIAADKGLNNNIPTSEITTGGRAADAMNALVVRAIKATGLANDGTINTADVRDLNAYIRANHLAEWTALHGDDENGSETGFHLVQDDGARTRLFGKNAVDTVGDGIYHLGFEIQDGRFLNEDGNANAKVSDVAKWLSRLLHTDLAAGTLRNAAVDPYARGTTRTGLDLLTNLIVADKGLNKNIATSEITTGAKAADAMNALIVEGIKATGVGKDGAITAADVVTLNAYIRANHLAAWTALHGDDENGSETGFHLVQDDGAKTHLFGKNAVDTVADGIYHLGFEIQDGRFLNEDGNANAKVSDVARWLNTLLRPDLTGGTL